MNAKVLAAAILAMAISIFVTVKLIGSGPAGAAKDPNLKLKPVIEPLTITKTGPQPKVSVPEREFPFERMMVGEERSHEFVFRNVGEAPLTIKMGETTCQCTYGDLKKGESRKILPGESQNIKLTWKPEFPADEFSKGADIWTDDPDPEQQKITLRVVGVVGTLLSLIPQKEWPCPDLMDNKPAICSGGVASGKILEDFKITTIESRGTPMEFELKPLEEEQLKASHSIFGYRILLTVKPDMQMGSFVFPVTIKTDVLERGANAAPGRMIEFEVLVSGVRRGPIRLAGPDWIEEKMGVKLGAFDANKGKQVMAPLFIRNPPAEGLRLTKTTEADPADLKVEIVREEKSVGKSPRLYLKFDYPAGAPRVLNRSENPGKVRLYTNHPDSPEVEILVYINAY